MKKMINGLAVLLIIVLAGATLFAACKPKTAETVKITASGDTVTAGESLSFSASVTGANNPSQTVTWIVSTNSDGTGAAAAGTNISPSGVLNVADDEDAGSLYVRATYTGNPDAYDYVRIRVTPLTQQARSERQERQRQSGGGRDSAGETAAEGNTQAAPGVTVSIEATPERTPAPVAPAPAARTITASELSGYWADDERGYEFKTEGSFQAGDRDLTMGSSGTWALAGNTLTLTVIASPFEVYPEPRILVITISVIENNRITLKYQQGDEVTITRIRDRL